MDTGGNAGSQASVSIVRGLSLGEIEYRDVWRIIWKEARVAVLCGVTLAAANFVKLLLLDRVELGVAIVVCSTLVLTVLVAKLVGCVLPIVAKRIGFDPAGHGEPVHHDNRRRAVAADLFPDRLRSAAYRIRGRFYAGGRYPDAGPRAAGGHFEGQVVRGL